MRQSSFNKIYFLLSILVSVVSCSDDNIPTPNPIIKVTGSAIQFGKVEINDTSQVRTYMIAAKDITSTITAKVNPPFYLSLGNNKDYSNEISLLPDDFQEGAVPVFVWFRPKSSEEEIYKDTIVHSSKDRQNLEGISVAGIASVAVEELWEISKSYFDFGNVFLDTLSGPHHYTISGKELKEDLTVEVDGPFLISINEEGGFSKELIIPSKNLSSSEVTVFVRFKPTEEGGRKTGSIMHSSSEWSEKTEITLSGNAISPNHSELFTEDFEYLSEKNIPSTNRTGSGDTNAALDGWIKIRGNNTDIPLSDKSLGYSGYPGSDIGNSVILSMENPQNNSNIYAHNLPFPQGSNFKGAYYTAFMLKVKSLPDGNNGGFNRTVMLVDWLPNGTTKFLSAVIVDYNDGDPKFGVNYEGAKSLTNITPEVGKTYVVVLKHIIPDTDLYNSNNAAAAYFFEEGKLPDAEPTTTDAMVSIGDTGDNFLVKAVTVVRDNSRGGSYIVDGIRVSTQWDNLFK